MKNTITKPNERESDHKEKGKKLYILILLDTILLDF